MIGSLLEAVLMGSALISGLWLVLAVPAFALPMLVGVGMNGFGVLEAEVLYGAFVFVGIPVSIILNIKVSGE
jgi:hypothetical protein